MSQHVDVNIEKKVMKVTIISRIDERRGQEEIIAFNRNEMDNHFETRQYGYLLWFQCCCFYNKDIFNFKPKKTFRGIEGIRFL